MSNTNHQGALLDAATLLRASHISRWGIVLTAKPQSIAEHMYRVWVLVHEWGIAIDLPMAEQFISERWAVTHDLPEIRTGDMPTPHKTPEVKAWLDQLEHDIYPPLTETHRMSKAAATLCKFCDTAESILFLKINGIGQHAIDVRELLARQMWHRLYSSVLFESERQTLHDLFNNTYDQT